MRSQLAEYEYEAFDLYLANYNPNGVIMNLRPDQEVVVQDLMKKYDNLFFEAKSDGEDDEDDYDDDGSEWSESEAVRTIGHWDKQERRAGNVGLDTRGELGHSAIDTGLSQRSSSSFLSLGDSETA